MNDRWSKSFSLWMGKFNRPNYEVEYSSSQREVLERSSVIRAIYPGERAIGAKLEFNPQSLPLHVQVAVYNGADALQIKKVDGSLLYDGKNTFVSAGDENKDFDNGKDIMLRATYNLRLGNFGGLDFGAHTYFREYQILFHLVQAKGELVLKRDLIKEIWGSSFDANTNTIEVYINFLRKKVDKPFGKDSIKTKIGFGYYFEDK